LSTAIFLYKQTTSFSGSDDLHNCGADYYDLRCYAT